MRFSRCSAAGGCGSLVEPQLTSLHCTADHRIPVVDDFGQGPQHANELLPCEAAILERALDRAADLAIGRIPVEANHLGPLHDCHQGPEHSVAMAAGAEVVEAGSQALQVLPVFGEPHGDRDALEAVVNAAGGRAAAGGRVVAGREADNDMARLVGTKLQFLREKK